MQMLPWDYAILFPPKNSTAENMPVKTHAYLQFKSLHYWTNSLGLNFKAPVDIILFASTTMEYFICCLPWNKHLCMINLKSLHRLSSVAALNFLSPANFMVLCSIELKLLTSEDCGNRDFRLFCSCSNQIKIFKNIFCYLNIGLS